jgi:putative thioredoxin
MLEKLEQAYGGRFKLVTIDTDAEQQLAQHFRIKSIPTVYAFVGGQPVDQFQGALPEGKLRDKTVADGNPMAAMSGTGSMDMMKMQVSARASAVGMMMRRALS